MTAAYNGLTLTREEALASRQETAVAMEKREWRECRM